MMLLLLVLLVVVIVVGDVGGYGNGYIKVRLYFCTNSLKASSSVCLGPLFCTTRAGRLIPDSS